MTIRFALDHLFLLDPDRGGNSGGDGGDEKKLTLTQAEIDAMIQTRLSRETAKYADYDQIKAAKEKLEADQTAANEAKKTADEKARDTAVKEATETLEAKHKAVVLQLQGEKQLLQIQLEVVKQANGQFHNLDTALLLLNNDPEIKVTDGKIEGIDKAIANLKKNHPYLVTEAGNTGKPREDLNPPGGGRTNSGSGSVDTTKVTSGVQALHGNTSRF